MSSILLLLQRVHQNVHQTVHTLTPKKYSEPRIYTGGVDITLWNQFSKLEQSTAFLKIGMSIINSLMILLGN